MRDLTKESPIGRWTVLRRSDKTLRGVRSYWVCQCECGKIRDVLTTDLTSGSSLGCQSCCKKKYPWDEWLTGKKVVTLDSQAEFGIAPQAFRQNLYAKAKAKGLVVNTEIEGSWISFHFRREIDPQIISAHGKSKDK